MKIRRSAYKTSNQRRFLVVDDESSMLLMLKALLAPFGFRVDCYDDPVKALSDFKRAMYDLLILDVKMPQMSGFELYRKLREIDDNVKVCFLTGLDDFADYEKYRSEVSPKQDERYFVRKPFSAEDFLERVSFMARSLESKNNNKTEYMEKAA